MALFNSVDQDEFDKFKKEMFSRVSAIENSLTTNVSALQHAIDLKVTDSEQAALESANNSADIERNVRNTASRVEEILKVLEECSSVASSKIVEINESKAQAEESAGELKTSISDVQDAYKEFNAEKEKVDISLESIYGASSELSALLAKRDELSGQVVVIESISVRVNELNKNISDLLEGSIKRKSKIDEIHNEIFGYQLKGEDGAVQEVEGLYSELDNAYGDIKEKIEGLDDSVSEIGKLAADKYESQLNEQLKTFEGLIKESNDRFSAVDEELKGLMPGGMAAGLSAAYEEKKRDEGTYLTTNSNNFSLAILVLIAVSLIPFCVDAYLLIIKGKDLVDVIKDTPNLILSILPLYFPVLWFAFSASKKVNLSKRLIEEYTHKAVLGKTFSGLSNQISSLPHESEVREDLRTRLLFNMLQVSSENPGKLITDYNKSDHPLMEALENSAKLGSSVDALSKIPGFSALANKLSRKSKEIMDVHERKVTDGLGVQDALEADSKA
ncbi:hypothetical protein [Pseudomonas sp. M30-35]|uniref:hypothetical protein n=1 Tax=Pseudomonas sp. M30-35 TaxID=1981174 RepID=UPI000B3C8146|nr:hypothetical protein [Pseudomonas sp. M30-35]ARU87467.1 hypothetical protein B9K09_05555 [Pseudomonas sp. M30-35]